MKQTIAIFLMMLSICAPLAGQSQELQRQVPYIPRFLESTLDSNKTALKERTTVKYQVTLLLLKPDAPMVSTGVFSSLEDAQEKFVHDTYARTLSTQFVSTTNAATFSDTQSILSAKGKTGYDLEITPTMEDTLHEIPIRVRSKIKYSQRLFASEEKGLEEYAIVTANPVMSKGELSVQTWTNGGERFALVIKLTDAARETAEAIDDAAPKTGT